MAAKTTKANGNEKPARPEAVTVCLLVYGDGCWQVGRSVEDVTLRAEENECCYGNGSYATPVKVVKVKVPVAWPRVEEIDLTPPAALPARAA